MIVNDVRKKLTNVKIPGITHVYSYSSTPAVENKQNTCSVILSDLPEIDDTHGSNGTTSSLFRLRVLISKGSQNSIPIDTIENSIVSFFVDKNNWPDHVPWIKQDGSYHTVDPDRNWRTLSYLYFEKRINKWN